MPPGLAALTVVPTSKTDELSATAWRLLPIGEIVDTARENWNARRPTTQRRGKDYQRFQQVWQRRPGPPGYPEWAYAYLAQQYVGVWEAGSRSPVLHLADELGWSARAVKKRVQIARDLGLLEASVDGARLTVRAKELLRGGS